MIKYVIGLLVIVGLLWMLSDAPEGYEDEDGFHHGKPPKDDDEA